MNATHVQRRELPPGRLSGEGQSDRASHRRRSVAFALVTVLVVLILGSTAVDNAVAGTFSEGFENAPGSYDLFTSGGGGASLVSSPVHGGGQALDLSLTTSSDYARVKLDVSASNLSLGQITSADYWVDRTAGDASSQLPYIIFSINTPGSGGDSTLAVMFNDPAPIASGVYTDLTVGPDTVFHIEGDTTGLTNPSNITLAALDASTYSPGVSWGSFGVQFVRIGYGMAGSDGIASNTFLDDLTIHTASAPVPEPGSLSLAALALGCLWIVKRRKTPARWR